MPKGKHGNHVRGSLHYRWTGEKVLTPHGYVKVRVGRGHPLADPNGYTYEHLLVWCAAGNEKPARGYTLHHRSGERTDNRIENLELLRRGQHNAIHNAQRQRDVYGRFVPKAVGRLLDGVEHNAYLGKEQP